MDNCTRNQIIIDNLKASLRDLDRQKLELLVKLSKVDIQIEKHKNFLKLLGNIN